MFDKLKLDPSAKKTKTGQYQTGEDVLLKLAAKGHQIVDDILAFRELTKLKSTYVDSLPELINKKTGRVHTTYGQAVAVTGRLASNNLTCEYTGKNGQGPGDQEGLYSQGQ